MSSPAFEDGGPLPGMHHIAGGNVQPELNWVGAPAETQSFAIFFHDVTINFDHSAIWDIPASATGIPEGVEHVAMPPSVPGAVQCDNWPQGLEYGYGGPGSPSNFYQFTLYAIDVASIPEINQDSSRSDVRAAFVAHAIAETSIQCQSTGPG